LWTSCFLFKYKIFVFPIFWFFHDFEMWSEAYYLLLFRETLLKLMRCETSMRARAHVLHVLQNTKARVQRGERAVNAFVVRARSLIFAPRYFLLRTRRYTYRTRWPLRSDINLCIHCASLNANRSPTRPETYQQNSEYWNTLFDDTWKLKLSEDYISIQFEQIIRRINLLNSYYKNWNRIIFTKFR